MLSNGRDAKKSSSKSHGGKQNNSVAKDGLFDFFQNMIKGKTPQNDTASPIDNETSADPVDTTVEAQSVEVPENETNQIPTTEEHFPATTEEVAPASEEKPATGPAEESTSTQNVEQASTQNDNGTPIGQIADAIEEDVKGTAQSVEQAFIEETDIALPDIALPDVATPTADDQDPSTAATNEESVVSNEDRTSKKAGKKHHRHHKKKKGGNKRVFGFKLHKYAKPTKSVKTLQADPSLEFAKAGFEIFPSNLSKKLSGLVQKKVHKKFDKDGRLKEISQFSKTTIKPETPLTPTTTPTPRTAAQEDPAEETTDALASAEGENNQMPQVLETEAAPSIASEGRSITVNA